VVRVANHEVLVIELAERIRGEPFVWGQTDCASVCRRILTVMLGVNPWRDAFPRYTTLREARRAFRKVDMTSIWDGALEVRDRLIVTGDIGIAPQLDGHRLPSLYVALPRSLALIANPAEGTTTIPRAQLLEGTRWYRYG
jgi:hypothetical protein